MIFPKVINMLLKKSTAIPFMLGILGLPLIISKAASATEFLLRANCLHPLRGEESCEISLPDSQNTDVWDVKWTDGVTTRIRLDSLDDNAPIQYWDFPSEQWISSDTTGLCWEYHCIHLNAAQMEMEESTAKITVDCSSPTLGESQCQAEWVPETDGIRVYWPDDSIGHYLFTNTNGNNTPLQWSYADNDWVKSSNFGMCFDKQCLIFDSTSF